MRWRVGEWAGLLGCARAGTVGEKRISSTVQHKQQQQQQQQHVFVPKEDKERNECIARTKHQVIPKSPLLWYL